jgi:hypothetical protein
MSASRMNRDESYAAMASERRRAPAQGLVDPLLACWVSTHGFDPGFHGGAAPADARLVRAAQQLFRRAVGIPGDPPG